MAYSIRVHEDFIDELNRLDHAVKQQLRKKLDKVIENPHIPKNRLGGDLHGCYKIKLKRAGVRLVYQVNDEEIYILLLTVGKRADNEVYNIALNRI